MSPTLQERNTTDDERNFVMTKSSISELAPAGAREFVEGPHHLFIGGEYVQTKATIDVKNPATGDTLTEVPLAGSSEVDAAVAAARRAFPGYRGLSGSQRAKLLWALSELVDANASELAAIEVLDNGKPLGEAVAVDVALAGEIFRYYAGCAATLEGAITSNSVSGMLTLVHQEPIGVVAALTPWNFPLLETAYKLGPSLAAGCTVVLKPSELAPLSTLRLMRLIERAGFAKGVVNVVIGGPEVGDILVRHEGVDKVAFTGQTETGRVILRAAAEGLKPVSLELGGKSPNIVFPDANLDAATAGVFGGIFFNQGQACVAGSRLLVHASVADRLVESVVSRARVVRLGEGFQPSTDMGPLISAAHRDRVLGFVDEAVAQGAELAVGGKKADVEGLPGGYFACPTVLTGVRRDMQVAQEEIFGPVLSVVTWEDEEELVEVANDVRYGIAAGIWTSDTAKALALASRLEVGTVWINTYGMFDVTVPFGGRKQSGGGRELGHEALKPYLVAKSVWVNLEAVAVSSGQSIGR
jgi:phenylacetaldehyde dehydrogenase